MSEPFDKGFVLPSDIQDLVLRTPEVGVIGVVVARWKPPALTPPTGTPSSADLSTMGLQWSASASLSPEQLQGSGHTLVTLGGDYWHLGEFPLGGAFVAGAGSWFTGAFLLSAPVVTLRVAADALTSVVVDVCTHDPQADTGGTVAWYDPLDAPKVIKELDGGDQLLGAYGSSYRVEGAARLTVDGCSPWRQVSFVLTEHVGSAVLLRVTVAGVGLVYLGGLEVISEPPSGLRGAESLPVWGFADLHSHPMATHAFGGHLISGRVDPASVDAADIGGCEGDHSRGGSDVIVNNWPDGHQAGGRRGGPDFATWPTFMEGLHSQMHPAWIRRAYDGGLRLMVALVVNNTLLADQRRRDGDPPSDDASAIAEQVAYMRAVAAANDNWMQIVTSPSQARAAIHAGRLAVVLGIEVDAFLGLWVDPTEVTSGRDSAEVMQVLRDQVRRLRDDLGVVQLNPVHLTDNAFGGTAIYDDAFNVVNHHVHGGRRVFAVRAFDGTDVGSDPIDFRVGEGDPLGDLITGLAQGMPPQNVLYGEQVPGHGMANALGETPELAPLALRALMEAGMVIDVDHMSELTTTYVLDRCAEQRRPEVEAYPVVSAHMNFRELSPRRRWGSEGDPGPGQRADKHMWPHESQKSRATAQRILDVGGMLAPITSARDALTAAGSAVANDCPGTSKTFAQEFSLAATLSAPHRRGVGVGSDMSLNPMLGPRFGPLACYGLVDEGGRAAVAAERHRSAWLQDNPVVYAGPVTGPPRFFSPPQANATGRLDPGVFPQDSDVDGLIAGRYELSISAWRALWLHAAGAEPGPDERDDVKALLRGFRTAARPHDVPGVGRSDLDGLARLGFELLVLRRELDQLTDHPDLTDRRSPARIVADAIRRWEQLRTGPNVPLQRCVAGIYGFDVNVDGLAHYGLLPDLLQDLRNVGAGAAMFEPLFASAESYLQVWERCILHARLTEPVVKTEGSTKG